ncbi:MAG: EscU/YscU/HrcU family type III secretion system export apparatus switch protein [Myxococcota bacterium]
MTRPEIAAAPSAYPIRHPRVARGQCFGDRPIVPQRRPVADAKTEQPTPRRLRRARQEGFVPRSRALTALFVLAVALGMLPWLGTELSHAFRRCFASLSEQTRHPSPRDAASALLGALDAVAWPVGVFFLAVLATAATVAFLQVGPVFASRALTPRANRIGSVGLLDRMQEGAIELLLSTVGLILLSLPLIYFLTPRLVLLAEATSLELSETLLSVLGVGAVHLLLAFAAFAVADAVVRRVRHVWRLRMTVREVRDEERQTMGDPTSRTRRRRRHRELLQEVPLESQVGLDTIFLLGASGRLAVLRYVPEKVPVLLGVVVGDEARRILRVADRIDASPVAAPSLVASLQGLPVQRELPRRLWEPAGRAILAVEGPRPARTEPRHG